MRLGPIGLDRTMVGLSHWIFDHQNPIHPWCSMAVLKSVGDESGSKSGGGGGR